MSFRDEVQVNRKKRGGGGGKLCVFVPMYFEGEDLSFEVPVPVEFDSITIQGDGPVHVVGPNGEEVSELNMEGGYCVLRKVKTVGGSLFSFRTHGNSIRVMAVAKIPVVRVAE